MLEIIRKAGLLLREHRLFLDNDYMPDLYSNAILKDEKFQMVGADGNVWRKTHNSPGDYSFTVTRDMIRQEVSALFQAQRDHGNPYAVETLEAAYTEILFSQRHFDEGPGGNSPYQKGDLR